MCLIPRVMELTSTLPMNTMRGSGMQTSAVVGDECIMLMVQFMRESGTMT